MTKLPAPEIPRWIERMMPFDERYALEIDGLRVHVMEQGEGWPVLMLHGNPTWGFLYRKIAQRLIGEHVRLIVPDLIGLGYSDRPPAGNAPLLAQHGRWMGQLIDALGLEALTFVGQDWGGAIGLLGIAESRASLRGLVMLNTAVTPPKPGFRPTMFHRFSQLPVLSTAVFRGLGFPQGALWAAQGDPRSIRGRVARAYRHPLRGWRRNAAPLAMARMVPNRPDHPSIEALRRSQAVVEDYDGPAAIVWGMSDPILRSVVGWMEKLLPQAKVTRTEAGHFLQEEIPDEIADALLDVIAQLPEASRANP